MKTQPHDQQIDNRQRETMVIGLQQGAACCKSGRHAKGLVRQCGIPRRSRRSDQQSSGQCGSLRGGIEKNGAKGRRMVFAGVLFFFGEFVVRPMLPRS